MLLLILVAPALVTFGWLHYRKSIEKHSVKERMIEGINKNELVQFRFTKTDLKTKLDWKHPREFEYNDRMYDIVETETYGDTVIYWCWQDDKETQLNRQIGHLVTKVLDADPEKREKQDRMLSFFSMLFFQESLGWPVPHPAISDKLLPYNATFPASNTIPPPVPPPQYS